MCVKLLHLEKQKNKNKTNWFQFWRWSLTASTLAIFLSHIYFLFVSSSQLLMCHKPNLNIFLLDLNKDAALELYSYTYFCCCWFHWLLVSFRLSAHQWNPFSCVCYRYVSKRSALHSWLLLFSQFKLFQLFSFCCLFFLLQMNGAVFNILKNLEIYKFLLNFSPFV